MSTTQPKPGQFFMTGSLFQDMPHGGPAKLCLSVSKSRVYFRRQSNPAYKHHAEEQADFNAKKPEFCSADSVTIVRDTAEELWEVQNASRSHLERVHAAREASRKQLETDIEAIRAKYAA